jgi:cell wall-associated NlpC family hydrolase
MSNASLDRSKTESKKDPNDAKSGAPAEILIVAKNLINLYKEPSTDSEVVTQAFINSELRVEKREKGFAQVVGTDLYKGWADLRHVVTPIDTPHAVQTTKGIVTSLFCEVFKEANRHSELVTKLVYGSEVRLVNGSAHGEFDVLLLPGSERAWVRRPDLTIEQPTTFKNWATSNQSERRLIVNGLGKNVLANARKFIGVPYLWGGGSAFGIDCSALVQLCYRLEGLQLLRDADQQFEDKRFRRIEEGLSLGQAKFEAGDLLVFGTKSVIHIGVASGDGRFIHASGRQSNFGTYFDVCSSEFWNEIYMGAVRLGLDDDLSIEAA